MTSYHYTTLKGENQEVMKKNLFIPLCAFLIMAANIGWTMPIRFLVGVTSVLKQIASTHSIAPYPPLRPEFCRGGLGKISPQSESRPHRSRPG